MSEYKDLATLYYMDNSSNREARIQEILDGRKTNDSTFILEYSIPAGDLFIAVPRELSNLTQRVLRRERKVSKLMQELPGIAGNEVLRSLVIDEVVMSNSIENIHSTRKQIEEVLAEKETANSKAKRFKEFAKLYFDLSDGNYIRPDSIEDIRKTYDQVMSGEASYDKPDGDLFRKDTVFVTSGLKQEHSGLTPEAKIVEALQAMLRIVDSEDIPELYSALASHFVFEYAHPFYDGNGRTGRYLLAVYLEAPLSKATVLSLSRIIAENKNAYYQAFNKAEDPLNHGELTFFIMTLHELILKAQEELITRLEHNIARWKYISTLVMELRSTEKYPERELTLIYALAQQAVFGINQSLSLEALAEFSGLGTQQTRKYLASMEEKGVVTRTRERNPIMFALTNDFFQATFPEENDG